MARKCSREKGREGSSWTSRSLKSLILLLLFFWWRWFSSSSTPHIQMSITSKRNRMILLLFSSSLELFLPNKLRWRSTSSPFLIFLRYYDVMSQDSSHFFSSPSIRPHPLHLLSLSFFCKIDVCYFPYNWNSFVSSLMILNERLMIMCRIVAYFSTDSSKAHWLDIRQLLCERRAFNEIQHYKSGCSDRHAERKMEGMFGGSKKCKESQKMFSY